MPDANAFSNTLIFSETVVWQQIMVEVVCVMWKIRELKRKGRKAVTGNYRKSVLAALVIVMIGQLGLGANWIWILELSPQKVFDKVGVIINEVTVSMATLVLLFIIAVSVIVLIVASISIFLINPIEVGTCKFFVENAKEPAEAKYLKYAFSRENYVKVVDTMLIRSIIFFFSFLLFTIPGIVKCYEYCMVPYLLADRPELDRKQIFQLSKEMMHGQKWKCFLLDLSFLLWYVLELLSCNIVGAVWGVPYRRAVKAELYLMLKEGR